MNSVHKFTNITTYSKLLHNFLTQYTIPIYKSRINAEKRRIFSNNFKDIKNFGQ